MFGLPLIATIGICFVFWVFMYVFSITLFSIQKKRKIYQIGTFDEISIFLFWWIYLLVIFAEFLGNLCGKLYLWSK
jgi:uncharacterized protein YhhL (DUF1145 family)